MSRLLRLNNPLFLNLVRSSSPSATFSPVSQPVNAQLKNFSKSPRGEQTDQNKPDAKEPAARFADPWLSDVWQDLEHRFLRPNLDSRFFQESIPKVDIVENEDCFTISADLPGMEKKDIQLKLHDDTLLISGERKSEVVQKSDDNAYKKIERHFGSFSRQFRLPDTVNRSDIVASYDAGVLQIELKKKSTEAQKGMEIEIK
eukprot:CAMPEP_0201475102 /NCGR_PEP_ID=MMETSP0151_2-20130828/573_1 /ASSEMBLY_ACC=CAM_ASM_000257 /TAXON_ID=200890 /ORGANISM="Paramoeba atlantica, Strain 621/1 / CCAP 1560/9" /LENGTH=200 /DNA_ID=CAMNT_0047855115 /DNA_START=105 /DNA_END=707 /DNA_ORIENTATION=-